MGDESLQRWIEDFATPALTDAELKTLESSTDATLHRVAGEALLMRWAARILLERLDAAGVPRSDDEPLRLAAWFLECRHPNEAV